MRRYSDWIIFGIPAGLAVLLVLMGKISTADTAEYIKHSRVVFEGLKVAPYDYAVYRPPLFGAVIAMLGEISHSHQAQLTIVINLLVAFGALWLVLLSRPLSTTERIVAIVLMFANVWFFREMFSLRETAWYTLFCALFVLICQRLHSSPLLGAYMGAICGVAMLTRPTGAVFFVASTILIAVFQRSWKRAILNLSSLVVVTGIILLPWQLYLQDKFDRIQLTGSCSGGFTLFKGNHPIMGNLEPNIDLDAADAFVWDYAAKNIPDPAKAASLCARSDFLGAVTRADMMDHPARTLKSLAASLAYILAPMPIPLGSGGVGFDEGSQQLKIVSFYPRPVTSFVSVFYYAGVYIAALAGLLLTRKEDLRWVAPVCLLFLGHALIYATTLAEIRFRMPFEPFLCVLAAIAVVRLFNAKSS